MEKELKDLGLTILYNEAEDRKPIDFSIADEEDNVCWVWGEKGDIEVECSHPSCAVEYDDDDPVGECAICGATCDCHYEADNGNVEEYAWSGRKLVPHEWYFPKKIGGIVGDYLKELQEKW